MMMIDDDDRLLLLVLQMQVETLLAARDSGCRCGARPGLEPGGGRVSSRAAHVSLFVCLSASLSPPLNLFRCQSLLPISAQSLLS